MDALLLFLAARRKAIVGAVVGVVTNFVADVGLDLTEAQTAWLTVALTTISVYLVPNKPTEA